MFSSGVKGLICNPVVMQCGRAKVLSATCTSFHFWTLLQTEVSYFRWLMSQTFFVYCIVSKCASKSNSPFIATDTNIPGMHIVNWGLNWLGPLTKKNTLLLKISCKFAHCLGIVARTRTKLWWEQILILRKRAFSPLKHLDLLVLSTSCGAAGIQLSVWVPVVLVGHWPLVTSQSVDCC